MSLSGVHRHAPEVGSELVGWLSQEAGSTFLQRQAEAELDRVAWTHGLDAGAASRELRQLGRMVWVFRRGWEAT